MPSRVLIWGAGAIGGTLGAYLARGGAERTIGAFVNFGADYLEPGVIHYAGRGPC